MRTELDRRALGRALTKAANASVADVLSSGLSVGSSPMRRIAITGAPGVGKSSLTGLLAKERLEARPKARIGILAIDPSSRYSGGAVLGDRIRIDALASDPQLFIRSLASRTGLEGLADNIGLVFATLERFDFDEAIIETVGAGQTDCAVRELADTVVLVTNPESGDTIQAMKAGIMETTDIYVINKADLPGAAQAASFLRSGLDGRLRGGWAPPIIETSQSDRASAERLSQAIDAHQEWLAQAADPDATGRKRAAHVLQALVQRRVSQILADKDDQPFATLRRLGEAFSEMSRAAQKSRSNETEPSK